MKPQRRRVGRRKSSGPHPVDVHVGSRIRLRRNMLGLSQEKLGDKIELTFQQVQKYERGSNRVGASRLHELSKVLDVPIRFFFDDTDPVRAPAITEEIVCGDLGTEDERELVSIYHAIKSDEVRKRLFALAKSLAPTPSESAVQAAAVG